MTNDHACQNGRVAAARFPLGAALVLALFLLSGTGGRGMAAQKTAAGARSVPNGSAIADPSAVLPGAAAPDVFLLPDKQGRLQKVLGFSYEDFVEAYKIKHQIGQARKPPSYTIQRLVVTGSVKGSYAALQFEMTVALNTDQPVRVPLGLTHALLREPVHVDGPDDVLVRLDRAAGGYVVWLHETPGASRRITLKVFVPLIRAGSETILRINPPRATYSRLVLAVNVAKAIARVRQGAAVVETTPTTGGTQLTVAGVAGDFELAWHAATAGEATGAATVLEAAGVMLARVDDHGTSFDVKLSVRSFGGRFDHFRVRLPAGAELVTLKHPGYTIVPVSPAAGKTKHSAGRALVDVRLEKETAGPVEIRLVTQQPRQLAGSEKPFVLAGFDVVGAIRQFGHVAVEVVGDWHVQWTGHEGVVRVDVLPESLRRDGLTTGFEYYRQPFALKGRLVPRRTHVQVEPDYLILVGARQAQLEARLRYTVRVKKAFAFRVDLAGWKLDRQKIGPANVFDVDGSSVNQQGVLSVPLLTPSKGHIELTLKARRPAPKGSDSIQLPLPIPRDVSLVPATVIVLPDDNVELTPSPEGMVGLTPQRIAAPIPLPPRQQAPLCYRADAEQSRFAGKIRVHSRSVAVDLFTRLALDQQGGRVQQTLTYHVAYEPVDNLVLDMPRWLANSANPTLRLNGQPLAAGNRTSGTPQASGGPARPSVPATALGPAIPRAASGVAGVHGPTKAVDSDPRVPAPVALPKAMIGVFRLEVNYAFSWQGLASTADVPVAIPLVVPAEGVGKNDVSVTASPTIEVAPRGDAWATRRGPVHDQTRQRLLHLAATGRQTELPLSIRLVEDRPQQQIVVERLWLQTWLTDTIRQDRAVYRLHTSGPTLEVTLPNGVQRGDVMVLLDGKRVASVPDRAGQLSVPVSTPANVDKTHWLEFRYLVRSGPGLAGRLTLVPPRLADHAWIQHAYWELVLPGNICLGSSGEGFAQEFVWGWCGWYWGRRAVLTTTELEVWSGATLAVRPPAAANRYLLSSVGRVVPLGIWVASRAALVLTASGAAFVVGLLLIYVPAVRRRGLWLVGAAVLLILAVRFPVLSLLAGQAAVLGVVFALLAGWLKFAIDRSRRVAVATASLPGSSVQMASGTTVVRTGTDERASPSSVSTREMATGQSGGGLS